MSRIRAGTTTRAWRIASTGTNHSRPARVTTGAPEQSILGSGFMGAPQIAVFNWPMLFDALAKASKSISGIVKSSSLLPIESFDEMQL